MRGSEIVLLACGLCGCNAEVVRDRVPADVMVSVERGIISAPDSIGPGWARVRVEEDGGGHIVVVFRLPDSTSSVAVAAFLAALDTAPATPRPGVAKGGPEIGDVGDVIMEFTPGRYLLGCVRRGSNDHRHASSGEFKMLVVRESPVAPTRATPPAATQVVHMADFAYVGADEWAVGSQMLRVENSGRQDHQLRIVRLRTGSTIRDWMDAEHPEELGTPVAGMARLSPGEVAYLPVELSAGAYVAYCLITDAATGKAHVELGMMRSIVVK